MGKNKKIAIILTIALILECLLVIGGKTSEAAGTTLKVTSPKSVAVNCSITIKTNVKAKFSTSNKKIATVNSKGVVKGKKEGTVKITVTSKSDKNQKKIITIKVKNQLVVTAPENSKATLYVGDTVKIKTNLSSKYKSSDTSVATVSSSGKVTAKKVGTAKITVTSKNNKKLKKTVTIIVEDKSFSTTTEQATTQQNTTEQDTSEIITPNPGVTTEDTTEGSTTEKPTTETPSTEEPYIVGIEAKYRGDKVPNNLNLITYLGIDLKFAYNDNTKEEIILTRSNFDNFTYTKSKEEVIDGETFVTYKVCYNNFETEMKVQIVDLSDSIVYPVQCYAKYKGETIKEGESPDLNDISITLYDSKGSIIETEVDVSKLRLMQDYDMGIEGTKEYEYNIIYDYTFEDSNGNSLYVCRWHNIFIPYE